MTSKHRLTIITAKVSHKQPEAAETAAEADSDLQKRRNNMMPLTLADIGTEQTVRKIGGSAEMKKHLQDLGFTVGGGVTVITSLGGNVIVSVKESRIAISREMAGKIMV